MPGSAAGITLGVDTVREFRVLANSYSAEYGRSAGGVVTVVTRSGSNQFQGGGFLFHRNSALDARNYFDRNVTDPTQESGPPPFTRYQYGFTLGGRIRQNKTFFFLGYEGLQEKLTTTRIAVVPNALARQGIIQNLGRVGQPLVQVAVPAIVQPWLNVYPLPNGRDHGNGTADLVFEANRTVDQNYLSLRIDHAFSDNHRIFGRYTLDPSELTSPQQTPLEINRVTARNQYLTVQFDSVLSSTLVNTLRFGLNRSVTSEIAEFTGLDPERLTFVPGVSFVQGGDLTVTGLSRLGFYLTPKALRYTMPEISNDLTFATARHTFKTGVLVKLISDFNGSVNARAGRSQIRGGLWDFMRGVNVDFIMEWPGRDQDRLWQYNYLGFYVQDDWRLTPRFTLNLGVREEFLTSPNEADGKCSNVTELMATEFTVGCPFFETFKNNWAPRVGFAWDVKGDARLVVRGGGGLFYDLPFSTYWRAAGRFGAPYTIIYASTARQNFGALPDLTTPPTRGFEVRTQSYTATTFSSQYNVSVQSEVRPGTAVTLGYMGSLGRNLIRSGQINTRPYTVMPDGRKLYALTGPRLNPLFNDIRLQQTDASSDYNALVASIDQRFGAAVRFQGSYTFSRTMTEADTVFGIDFSGGDIATRDPWDPSTDRGLAGYHVAHVFSFNGTYELPFKGDGPLGGFASGWQVSGIVSATSGVPFSVITAQLVDGTTGGTPYRPPDLAAGASNNPVLGGPDRYFDDSGFVLPAPGYYGNLGRNTIMGPGLFTADLLVAKTTTLKGNANLQFRAEIFNLFGRVNFANPTQRQIFNSAGVRNPLAGRIESTSTKSRQIQLGVRVNF